MMNYMNNNRCTSFINDRLQLHAAGLSGETQRRVFAAILAVWGLQLESDAVVLVEALEGSQFGDILLLAQAHCAVVLFHLVAAVLFQLFFRALELCHAHHFRMIVCHLVRLRKLVVRHFFCRLAHRNLWQLNIFLFQVKLRNLIFLFILIVGILGHLLHL